MKLNVFSPCNQLDGYLRVVFQCLVIFCPREQSDIIQPSILVLSRCDTT
jgi:hypothetical protein